MAVTVKVVQSQTAGVTIAPYSVIDTGGQSYTGEYSVTPSDEAQVLDTKGKRMTANVTVSAIPSNYGHIAWNGSTLSVY